MDTIKLEQAERELPELIHRANAGETIIIETPSGERVRLEPETRSVGKRPRGFLKGRLETPARLFEPMSEEELEDWYGKVP